LNRHQVIKAEPDIEAFKAAALRCPLPSAVELIGEKWAFLILRGALNGLEHFEQFQAALGIARNILSNRLAKLVEGDAQMEVNYSLEPWELKAGFILTCQARPVSDKVVVDYDHV